jgi:CIC family chloride channel protein
MHGCWTVNLRLPTRPTERAYEWLRGNPSGLVVLALVIGVGAGLGAIAFRYLIEWFTLLFSGSRDYSAMGHASHPWFPALGAAFVLLAPAVGGLLYGPLVDFFAREARGHGVPEVMLAVAEHGGRIRPQVAVVKSLASALCIGSGGSVGREGPIVQIGSALGSTLGQLLRVPESRLRLLVACGAAGGVSATFNAPIAGVVFALELILRDFEAESFGVVVLASVAANVIGRAAFGASAFLPLPAFHLQSVWEYGLYALLGVIAAGVALAFVRVLYGFEDLADAVWRGPEWLRPAVGGLALGGLLFLIPAMYGVGYPVLERAIRGEYLVGTLLVLLVAKIVATSLTIAIGGSGGVFAPSLFMGAMAGTAFGQVVGRLAPGIAGPAGAYGLVGMGAVFAAAARAPMTAVLIIFELTGEYQVILPLMFAIALAAGVGNLLSEDTIYTLKLRRRGIDVLRRRERTVLETLRVADAMQPVPRPVSHDAAVTAIVDRLASEGRGALPVVDRAGHYRGTVSAREVELAVGSGTSGLTAGSLAVEVPTLTVAQSLEEALPAILRSDGAGVPVLDDERPGEVVGWLTHLDVLRSYAERRGGRRARRARRAPPGGPDG